MDNIMATSSSTKIVGLQTKALLVGQRLQFGTLKVTAYTYLGTESSWSRLGADARGLVMAGLLKRHPKGGEFSPPNDSSYSRNLYFAHEWRDATPAERAAFDARVKKLQVAAEKEAARDKELALKRQARRKRQELSELRRLIKQYPDDARRIFEDVTTKVEKTSSPTATTDVA